MTTSIVSSEISVEDRQAIGERARDDTPLSAQADWEPAAERPDPVELLIEQNATREADLVPVRHGRMTVSPFTFYRGAAKVMATDLATTPMAGLVVQLCGDAHLSNFGLFASPERELLFGLNDFDETLPGPFEYDLKRMAASFTIAARNNGFTPADARAVTVESVKAYRLGMAEFAAMRTLDIWYAHMTERDIQDAMRAVEEASVAGAKPRKGKTGEEEETGRLEGRQGRVRPDRQSAQEMEQDAPQGPHPRQPRRVDQVRRGRRRPPSHRQPTARHHPPARPGGQLRDDTRAGPERRSRSSSASTRPPSATTADNSWTDSPSSTWHARWSASAASAPERSWCCCKAATAPIPCSSSSRRPLAPSSRTTFPRAATTLPAGAWWKVSGYCRPPPTSSSAGPEEYSKPTGTTTGASYAT